MNAICLVQLNKPTYICSVENKFMLVKKFFRTSILKRDLVKLFKKYSLPTSVEKENLLMPKLKKNQQEENL